ncbi:MAG: NTP transferase domain-containing protein [Myxococcales bacterium]|nr:NTP transferase domain-containing protein [Myxococcales bacterium]
MKAIVIGAGRGRRLEHLTEEIPKTLVPIVGRPMLESILEALAVGGVSRREVVFVCGYKHEVIRDRYPDLHYVENRDWENNNILLSLLCAREHLEGGFVSTYADIVYRPEAVAKLVASPHDITLVCDTDWRRRYLGRSEHPESDAEKLRLEGDQVVALSRRIPSEQATGEFIGVMRLTAAGAAAFLAAFDAARAEHADEDAFHEGRTFGKAYLIDLLAKMLDAGTAIHAVRMHGGYMEIDTTQDAALAESWWRG